MIRSLVAIGFLSAFTLAQAQTLVVPQVGDGGGLQTTIVLSNATANPASATMSLFSETGGGATQSWDLQFQEGDSGQNFTIPAAGTLLLHSLGTGATATVGWALVQASSGVSAYAILTQQVPGSPNQIATAPATAASSLILVPFDNTNGNSTSIVLVNPTAASETISVGSQLNSGTTTQDSAITLPANGHMLVAVAQQFPETASQSGQLELYSAGGSLAALPELFDPTGAFTAPPVSFESGTPIIISSGSTGGGSTIPPFSVLTITPDSSSAVTPTIQVLCVTIGAGSLCTGQVAGIVLGAAGFAQLSYSANFAGIAFSGQTITFSNLQVALSTVESSPGNTIVQITTGSASVTLTPGSVSTTGTVAGTLNLVSAAGTVNGSFTGTYSAQ